MLSAVTSAMLLLAAHSSTADTPAADLFVQRVSAACLEGASLSASQPVVDLSVHLTALAALPAALQQLRDAQQQAAQKVVSSQQETARSLRDSQKRLQAQLTALEKKLTTPPRPDQQCPTGWTRGGDSCFLVPSETTTWQTAHGACPRLDNRARLGSVHEDTVAVINSLSSAKVWVGLSQLSDSSPWFWADGTNLDYTNWAPSQPDIGGGESCALIRENGWHDYSCTDSYNYLCEINLH